MQFLGAIEPYLHEYGYVAVILGVFFESLGLPLPGESLVIASALLAAEGTLSVVPLAGCVWVASVLGDNCGYLIGRFGGRKLVLRHGARIGITEPRLAMVERFFARYGGQVVLFARFVVLLRQLNGVTAGTLAMPWRRFLLYNAIGGALWAGGWTFGVYFIGKDVSAILAWSRPLAYGLLAAAALGGLTTLAVYHYRKHR